MIRRTRPPFAPDARHLARFWLAGPLTCLLFTPMLFSGILGAPLMLPGMCVAWRLLRSGKDDFAEFAGAGILIGAAVPLALAPVQPVIARLFLFGLLFGPLMALTFRAISGSWRVQERSSEIGVAVAAR